MNRTYEKIEWKQHTCKPTEMKKPKSYKANLEDSSFCLVISSNS